MNKHGVEVKLDKNNVLKEMEYFQKYVVISYFMGGCPSYSALQEWINGLKNELKEECKLGRELGMGSFKSSLSERLQYRRSYVISSPL